jgi:hypothetical protein
MSKFYIYYNTETETNFCTAYEWNPHEDSVRRYCSHIGEGRFTHADIQLDVEHRVLYDKRTQTKYTLIEPQTPRENLQWETIQGEIHAWEDAF